jgi:hypothetical protein
MNSTSIEMMKLCWKAGVMVGGREILSCNKSWILYLLILKWKISVAVILAFPYVSLQMVKFLENFRFSVLFCVLFYNLQEPFSFIGTGFSRFHVKESCKNTRV